MALKVQYIGNEILARQLGWLGKLQLEALENDMSFRGLTQGRKVIEPFPGAEIECTSVYGIQKINITVMAADKEQIAEMKEALKEMTNYWHTNIFSTYIGTDDMVITADGKSIICGVVLVSGSHYDLLLAKLNDDGAVLWQKSLGETGKLELGRSLALDADENFYVAGDIELTQYSSLLVKYTSAGIVAWKKSLANAVNRIYSKMIYVRDDYIYLLSQDIVNMITSPEELKENMLVCKVAIADGAISWQREIGGLVYQDGASDDRFSNPYIARAIVVDKDEYSYTTGKFSQTPYILGCSFVTKQNTDGTHLANSLFTFTQSNTSCRSTTSDILQRPDYDVDGVLTGYTLFILQEIIDVVLDTVTTYLTELDAALEVVAVRSLEESRIVVGGELLPQMAVNERGYIYTLTAIWSPRDGSKLICYDETLTLLWAVSILHKDYDLYLKDIQVSNKNDLILTGEVVNGASQFSTLTAKLPGTGCQGNLGDLVVTQITPTILTSDPFTVSHLTANGPTPATDFVNIAASHTYDTQVVTEGVPEYDWISKKFIKRVKQV